MCVNYLDKVLRVHRGEDHDQKPTKIIHVSSEGGGGGGG